jgi:hypothetical protein
VPADAFNLFHHPNHALNPPGLRAPASLAANEVPAASPGTVRPL